MPINLDGAIRTIARSFPWASPAYIETMYCDAKDHLGILYWYHDVEEQNKQLEK